MKKILIVGVVVLAVLLTVFRQRVFLRDPLGKVERDGVAVAGTGAPEGDRSQGVNGYVLNTVTPETDTTCHYFWSITRNYRLDEEPLTIEFRNGVESIFHEDEIVLKAQQEAILANPGRRFYNLNIDSGGMWARNRIDAMLAKECQMPPPVDATADAILRVIQ